ncbi:MAG: hypothetical protein DMG59_04125 [Acidobacteria bacterium]|nr:MAG: hypothetical protein DMG59_04125 [Acidobacteriota bacterium]
MTGDTRKFTCARKTSCRRDIQSDALHRNPDRAGASLARRANATAQRLDHCSRRASGRDYHRHPARRPAPPFPEGGVGGRRDRVG